MDISIATTWWIVAGIAVAAELATGTFYLLMIALGLAAGALAAQVGFAVTVQVVIAALVGCVATGVLHWRRSRLPAAVPAASDRDVNLDIGQEIRVGTWGVDQTAKVHYRGSLWSARLAPGAVAAPGVYRVSAVEGNWLVLAPT
jgi:membrane protein implicated in regulation of membrane protease activity